MTVCPLYQALEPEWLPYSGQAAKAPAKSSGANAKSLQQQRLQNILRNPLGVFSRNLVRQEVPWGLGLK